MKKLILLHGALGYKDLFQPLTELLKANYEIYHFNFSGHGRTPFSKNGFGIEVFAEELDEFIQHHDLRGSSVFGYSMGGYVALYLESLKHKSFKNILTLGTKFGWTPEGAAKETSRMNPDIMEEKVPAFTSILEQRHGNGWKELVRKTADMMIGLGHAPLLNNERLAQIQIPVTINRGTEDFMVNSEESKATADQLVNGSFIEVQGVPHPLEKIDLSVLERLIRTYL